MRPSESQVPGTCTVLHSKDGDARLRGGLARRVQSGTDRRAAAALHYQKIQRRRVHLAVLHAGDAHGARGDEHGQLEEHGYLPSADQEAEIDHDGAKRY